MYDINNLKKPYS